MTDITFKASVGGKESTLEFINEVFFEPDYFVNHFEIEIFSTEIVDNESEEYFVEDFIDTKIGFLTLSLIESAKAMNNGVHLYDVVDSVNDEFQEVLIHLLDKKTNDVKEKYRHPFLPNFIYVEKLYIYKDYRSKGIAKSILQSIEKIIDCMLPIEYGTLVMLPSAFEYIEELDDNKVVVLKDFLHTQDLPNAEERNKKLVKFYKSVGFRAIPKTKVLYKVKPF